MINNNADCDNFELHDVSKSVFQMSASKYGRNAQNKYLSKQAYEKHLGLTI